LGRASRVTFTSRTAVVVVVPAGPTGVGDIDGVAMETSSGWPIPGPVDRTTPWTGEEYPLSLGGTNESCDNVPSPVGPIPAPENVTGPGPGSGNDCRAESDSDL
ncbi:hypothetical protein BRC79_07180, partial [Halobacteriales archaeon QH_8_67_27]